MWELIFFWAFRGYQARLTGWKGEVKTDTSNGSSKSPIIQNKLTINRVSGQAWTANDLVDLGP
jgi:hypothetical protein